jgi:hypothetical protein
MSDKNEANILDMDFGELVSPESSFVNPAPETPAKEEGKDTDPDPTPPVDEDIDVNKVLEGASDPEEEEEDPEQKVDDDGDTPPDSSSKHKEDDTSSDGEEPFTLVLARYQLEQGVLSSLDEEELMKVHEEEGPAAAMTYLLKKEVETNLEGIKATYEGYSKEYQELRDLGFSKEEAGATILDLERLENIDEEELDAEENENLRRAILKENYKATTKFTDSKIDRLIKRSFDLGVDVEDAKEAVESLKEAKKEEIKLQKDQKIQEQKNQEEQYKAQLQNLNETVNKLDEIIPGQKLTKATKDKLLKTITTPVKNDDTGVVMNAIWAKRNEDPMQFDTVLAYLLNVGVFDGKWDSILKTAGTRVSSKIEERLNNTKSAGFLSKGKRTTSSNSRDDGEDLIGPMRNLF